MSSNLNAFRSVDTHSILQDIRALQTTLDATDDDDEQRVLEEDVTGQILWLSWCGILSEVEQRLPEVVNYIRREGNTTTPEGRDCVRQGLREIGEIIRKALHAPMDDDVAHLRRIMLDAGAGLSKHHLWLAARAAEQDQWSSVTSSRNNNTFIRHAHVSAVHRTLGIGIGTI
ncbi:hypothetical protein PISMIDRAFT_687264 [Pisolithus microcarpus 441]|uniref:Uncharacterized protein n=1 Tax=Pisolithus microcarpus 441 TaxID=765257 RepID=A0A0C9YZD5_9AGAM|nr:hypothetical protein BKA83DRAFT_687264 [Pisolithus microcarpus]KIK15467.1 hypothetical protein PISMIDRAFT_687264 [Pisolithus microcarpus 441]